MEAGRALERAPGRGHGLHGDITDAVAQGPTAPALDLDLTAAAHRHGDTRPPLYCPTSNPSPVTTTATRRAAADTTTAAPATRGNALAPDLALPSNWTESENGSGTETESASTSPKNTNTSAAAATGNGETARGLAPTTESEREATRANTTAAAVTQDTAAIAADIIITHLYTHAAGAEADATFVTLSP